MPEIAKIKEFEDSAFPKPRRAIIDIIRDDSTFARYDSAIDGGLDVRFDCSKIGYMIANRARLSICNLPRDQIYFLTTWCYWTLAQAEKKEVAIYAGYGNDVSEIFRGYIISAYPTEPPDVWLNMEVIQNFNLLNEAVEISLIGVVTVRDILQSAAAALKLGLEISLPQEYQWVLDKKIKQFSGTFTGVSLQKELYNLGTDAEGNPTFAAYIENGIMQIRPSLQNLIKLRARGVQTEYDFLCSAETGMVGIPRPSPVWVDVQMLLRNGVMRQQAMKLESEAYDIPGYILERSARYSASGKISPVNGIYSVYNVRHVGHLRGNEWYTFIRGMRQNPQTARSSQSA